MSSFVAFWASGVVIGVGNAITGNATAVAIIVCVLFGAWSAFLLINASRFRNAQGVVRELSPQYLGSGVGFLILAILIGLGAMAGVYRW